MSPATGPQPVPNAHQRLTEDVPGDFTTWFEVRHIDDNHWQRFVDIVPIGRVYEIADTCRRFSASWKAFASALEDRARGHRRGGKAG